MMELKNIMKLLGGLGIPIAYHHFAEGESPEPPFLIYLTPGSHNFSADGMVYFKVKHISNQKNCMKCCMNWRYSNGK